MPQVARRCDAECPRGGRFQLPELVNGKTYESILEALIYEALVQLADQKVIVKGATPGKDAMTKKALSVATEKYAAWARKEMGAEWAAGIKVDYDPNTLKTGVGGVEITGFGGKITLTNTLQSRLLLAYETQLPKLRARWFQYSSLRVGRGGGDTAHRRIRAQQSRGQRAERRRTRRLILYSYWRKGRRCCVSGCVDVS